MRPSPWLAGLCSALLCLAVGPAGLSAQDAPRDLRGPSGWLRLEQGLAFPVRADVITARFAPAVTDLRAFLAGLDGDAAGLALLRTNRLGFSDLTLPAGADPLAAVAALAALPEVDSAEPAFDGRYTATPDDPSFSAQWHLHNTGQTGGSSDADVDAPEAWDLEDGDPSVVVAVLDSGTQHTHPDLTANVWLNPGEVLNGVDDDGNGYVDDIRGWDFDSGDNDPTGSFYHGTAVASVVGAASDNGLQLAGLAGGAVDGQGVSLMLANIGSFSPNSAVLDDAILYAADNGARVITLSLVVPVSSAITAAISYAVNTQGVFVDCASGNFGSSVTYPANLPTVMAVASTNHFDAKSSFSNPGPEVEVAAPGENLLMLNLGGGTITQSGTSFAAPMVAALAGLLFSADPGLTAAEVRALLRATADDVGPTGFDSGTGDGRINARAALEAALVNFVAGEAEPFGAGLAGAAGLPVIGVPGDDPPTQGDAAFAVTLRQGAPSATAWLVLGLASAALPFKGGTLLVDVQSPHGIMATTTTGTGAASVPLPIPDDPAYVGLQAYAQWVVADGGAPVGFALSGGLALLIGS